MTTSLKQIIPLSLALFALLGYQFIGATWTNAPASPPNSNVPAPINVGVDVGSAQTLAGGLAVDNFVATNISYAGVEMRSPRYCDENGNNCASSPGGGATMVAGWPDYIKCSGPTFNDYLASHNATRDSDGRHIYKIDSDSSHVSIWFNSDGSYYTGVNNAGWEDCRRSISQFYADGDAYDLVSGGGVSALPTCSVGEVLKYGSSGWECGTDNTGGGVPYDLVNGQHTSEQCTSLGGTIETDGSDSFCRFARSSCPSGWAQLDDWSTTVPTLGQDSTYDYCMSCTTASHAWSDAPRESCQYSGGGDRCQSFYRQTAQRSEIGCY